MTNHWTESLVAIQACQLAVDWCRTQPDLATAWAACERADWMLWLAGRLSGPAGDPRRITLALACADCTDTVPQSPIGAECLRVLRAWASGEATIQCVRTAAASASSAAYAAADAAYGRLAWQEAKAEHLRVMCEIVRRHYPSPPAIGE